MSEEILKALTQLFAIISSQDEGVSETERNFVIGFFKQELDTRTVEEYVALYDKFIADEEKRKERRRAKAAKKIQNAEGEESRKVEKNVNVLNSVRTLSLCRKINGTLTQKQKVIVLVKLLELVASDRSFTPQRMEIIHTVADVFNIPTVEFKLLEKFVIEPDSSELDNENILIFDEQKPAEDSKNKFIDSGLLDGEIIFVAVKSVGLYFTKYTGKDTIYLNNQPIYKDSIHLFAPGSIFRTPKGSPLYYSDLVATYNSDEILGSVSFKVDALEYTFPNGHKGLRGVTLEEKSGELIGIMGASGAGKTTLLNVLAGLEEPSGGSVKINGYNIHTEADQIEGVIGYIAQDDLLIEELTVFENLYYNARLCFKDMPEDDLNQKVDDVLSSLGLDRIKDLVVGSVLNKKISGGQRKRLNIALELIREPAVMFVDEPTSGLSSRDSENVIDLLKELSLKGKLIFVVIHQPSSDIYKMFDKMVILDTGGYPIFNGNPIEAVTYFKSNSGQVDSDRGQCYTCGNVNPEQIFNIIEAQVVDEYGEFTNKRKVLPQEWNNLYKKNINIEPVEEVTDMPPKTLNIPSKLMQALIFTTRDFRAKIRNTQYMIINLLEAPLLALLLAWIIRYISDEEPTYFFKYNDNIPSYILMCIVVALFMGLTVSAEEIIKDRKIQKRESFLNLSRTSYLSSKLVILFALSALQSFMFVVIGNAIVGIEGLNWMYWLVMFSVSCHANLIGLNVSSAFNSAITVYILIPILLIPQLVLCGMIFDYAKLNNSISEHAKVPVFADVMASRWGYEAIAVEHYKSNKYEAPFFEYDLQNSHSNYKMSYWTSEVENLLNEAIDYSMNYSDSIAPEILRRTDIIKSELLKDPFCKEAIGEEAINALFKEEGSAISIEEENVVRGYINQAYQFYLIQYKQAQTSRDSVVKIVEAGLPEDVTLNSLKKNHFNDKLHDYITNRSSFDMTVIENEKIVQLKDPIFNIPEANNDILSYRTHFFAPFKYAYGTYVDTLTFNVLFIWTMTLLLYVSLYFEVLAKFVRFLERVGRKLSNDR
ncbi:ATP-binding cassette domain-containing protein [Sediminitomix flava]|uniref:ABC-type multidrug transport system ATPase subunit n=1 Tax=Sediminitomix flava TaxID=379075 RepID=A0A315ZHC5_SEDFL|nr:ATP-binding cassette domain-containing protein [Sediminitomix flava]PWJ44692.1 ABC-type multidrug transport system ATPase subunit [Sediminitomix flava]